MAASIVKDDTHTGFVNGATAVCDQKILVFVLQMEKIQAEHMDGMR
jgi:hypothetical protein